MSSVSWHRVASSSTPARLLPSRRSTVSPTLLTGRTARRCKATAAPASLVVIGGGAIGLELAQAYSRFGSDVVVLEAGSRILGPEEPESSELITDILTSEGMDVRAGITIDGVAHDGERFHVTCGDLTFESEELLVSAGRTSRIDDIGLDTIGVDGSGRFLEVDDDQQVVDGLWAIGDIVGRGAFTHVAMYQSERAARSILGEPQEPYDTSLPRVTFTDPEVGGVGLTEQQARDQGLSIEVTTSSVASSSRGFVHGPGNEGLIKLVIDTDRDVLVGATSVGPTGGETLAGLAVAVRAEVPISIAAQLHLRLPDVLASGGVHLALAVAHARHPHQA